ncbi:MULTISPECIES: SMI1/KNR4 family protein [unclassified Mameliella]|uniref:SMI1/KNR4 family protein n=1 Tax=unclassified Mameliella TaxID=2630630 RepID=UPI00273D2547|nr:MULTISPECIES: SMI1/KNR4 family protein [unclassified Mameliella]
MTDPVGALLDRLRARLPRVDAFHDMRLPEPDPAPSLDPATLEQVRTKLDFEMPPVLVRVWQEIGNGGFGPGYALLGIGDGFADDQDATADRRYHALRARDPQRPTWLWPQGLLPICHLGCAMYDCIDTTRDRMLTWEPSAWDENLVIGTALFDTGLTLFDWFDRWSRGQDTFLLLDPDAPGDYALPRLSPLPG